MTRTLKFIAPLVALSCSFISNAENRWNVYAGGSLSHSCEKIVYGNDKTLNWGGGAFLGGGYEINFNSHWSLTPQLQLSFVNNGATFNDKNLNFYQNHHLWRETFSIDIPVIASFRFSVSNGVGLRFGAGPYIQEALAGKQFKYDTDQKENMSASFAYRFNVGIIGEAAVETGNHLSYFFRTQYPFLKEGWVRKIITLSVGVGYTF